MKKWLKLRQFYQKYKRWIGFSFAGAAVASFLQWQSNQIASRVYDLSITPQLSVATDFRVAYVGSSAREDNVVCVPIAVYNNSNAYALDVTYDLLMTYSNDSQVSLNKFFQEKNRPIPRKPRLAPGESWESGTDELCLSVVNNAVEIYKKGLAECKIQVDLEWNDIRQKKHKLIHNAQLTYAERAENSGGFFWFKTTRILDGLNGFLDRFLVWWHWGSSNSMKGEI